MLCNGNYSFVTTGTICVNTNGGTMELVHCFLLRVRFYLNTTHFQIFYISKDFCRKIFIFPT